MKYLDETGLDRLIKIIKARFTTLSDNIAEVNDNANTALTIANRADAIATDSKNLADEAKTAIDAMAALTENEVENVWNSAVNN